MMRFAFDLRIIQPCAKTPRSTFFLGFEPFPPIEGYTFARVSVINPEAMAETITFPLG